MGDIRTTTGERLPPTAGERRVRMVRLFQWLLLALLLIGLAGLVVRVPRYAPASGYATTSGYAEVRAGVTGRIAEILVSSGDSVQEGDLLLRLDDEEERATAAEAAMQVAKSEAELAYREAVAADLVRQHQNRMRAAELDLRHARQSLEVTRSLHDRGLASGRQLSEDEHRVAKAEDTVRALLEIDVTVEERLLEVLRREVQARQGILARAEAALARRAVRAPRAGQAVRYTFYAGELVRPDQVLYELFEGEVNQLRLRIPERYASRVKPGMRLKAVLGAYRTLPAIRFPGEIEMLRNVVESDGIRQYRMAYASLDTRGADVAPGTSAEIRIRLGSSSLWAALFKP